MSGATCKRRWAFPYPITRGASFMTLGLVNNLQAQNTENGTGIGKKSLQKTKVFATQQKLMFQVQWSKFMNEFWKMVKFGFVGAGAFLIHFCLYYLFTRFLMPEIYSVILYILAMGYAMTFNYSAHRSWTFSDHQSIQGSVYRYVIVVGLAALLNSSIFYLGHYLLNLYDLYVVLFASAIVPLITYAGHRWYTFKTN
ncbi:hypothetical protein GF391_03870 [Candidatus Uhrbacteria bacterium]|nr:hypothetical protein [Candidatus Uhrbacteria bacterium]